ncbi:MAG TPA: selenocysteine-specific translation elongation factor [Candidatus Cloacimonetes bacterium]|nr:selenocysteine-specific translation elongation factor [Candidatus Cloacimonadota bacterium]HEX37317.1 selenocysteine-specific translation elongation factor [Candidatus Cloacimonadota bacterium]
MKHLIMGTAGHVDHGKTALIQSLTQYDCDTHKEEKERGITIHLGFTHLDLPNGNSIGIIDVPGHKDFINTMIAGASTIDFVLFTIAADSSIMPQTREHLQIMELLGIKRGIIAVTKTDLVDDEMLELVEMEIQDFIEETFLADAPIIKTSVVDGTGIDKLIQCIEDITATIEERSEGEFFRMYIDRIFTVQGFGTVVNGSVLKGKATKSTKLYLLPGEKTLRIRGLEHHGEKVDLVRTGDRASLNVTGLDIDDFERGMLLSEKLIKPTKMIDAEITLFEHERALSVWNHALFLMDTFEDQVRIHLLDKDALTKGERGFVQINLDKACYPLYGDSFIIRSTSNDITLGGGKILDPYPLHHKRRTEKVLSELREISDKGLMGFISAEVKKNQSLVTLTELALMTNTKKDILFELVVSDKSDSIDFYKMDNELLLYSKDKSKKLWNKILFELRKHHHSHPLVQKGKTFEELAGILDMNGENQQKFLSMVLKEMIDRGFCKQVEKTYALTEQQNEITSDQQEKIDFINTLFIELGLNVPAPGDLIALAQKKRISEKELEQIVEYLVEKKLIVPIEGFFIHASIIEDAQKKLLDYLHSHDTITVAEFRDILGGNRKVGLLLLVHFDGEGITVRKGDYRILSQKWINKKS